MAQFKEVGILLGRQLGRMKRHKVIIWVEELNMEINLEELNETELWLVETMVRQMNLVVDQLYKNPLYEQWLSNDWFNLKEKLGLSDID
jgi:hypothetical protein